MCSFVMHRGLIIATIQFYFMVIFFFIDIPIFNGFLVFGYSTIFTNLPVIAIIMDEDLSFETVRGYPQLYCELQRGRLLNYKAFFIMLLKGVFQGSVIILLTITLFPGDTTNLVTIIFTSMIFTELLYTYTIVDTFNQISHISCVWLCTLVLSIAIYFLTIVFLNEYIDFASIDAEFMRKVGLIVLGSAGVIMFLEKVYGCIWPSYTEIVLTSLPPQHFVLEQDEPRGIDPLEIYVDDDSDSRKNESKGLLA